MERIRQLLSDVWQLIPPEYRVEIFGGILATVGFGVLVIFKDAVRAFFMRLTGRPNNSDALPPAAPSPPPLLPQQVEIKVIAQPPPQSEPAAVAPTPSAPSIPSPPIPRPPTIGFVARRDKAGEEGRDIVELLKEELTPGRNQLVTLSGPGGVGKTTLAAQAARELKDAYGGRLVWSYTEARAGYTLPALLDDIATQLGHAELRTLKPEAKEAAVRALVADPPVLVVLDNCETITPDDWQHIEMWFDGAQCSALFTSRQTINKTFNVKLLVMLRDEAEELLQRLVARTQDPQLFSADVRQQIYDTAEANPFLMEWVVAQINEAQEPATVFRELSEGEGSAAQRVFDRSFNLPQLGDDGRATLLALSLFTPSASREALAAVSGFGDDAKRLNEAVKNLHALWLIKALDQNRRLTVEGLTRSLASARLRKDEHAGKFIWRFAVHFMRYASKHSKPTSENYDTLEVEKDNLLRATRVAFANKEWQGVLLMMFSIAQPTRGVLSVRGYWDEALRIGELALNAARSLDNSEQIAALAQNVAVMRQDRGELDEARKLYNESMEIAGKNGYKSTMASTLHQLAILAHNQNEFDKARKLYNESMKIFKSLNNQRSVANSLGQLGNVAYDQKDFKKARRLYNKCLAISKELNDERIIARVFHQLGMIAEGEGELTEALRLYNDSLNIKRKIGDQEGIAITLHGLGSLALVRGEKTEAVHLFRESLSILEKLKSPNAMVARHSLNQAEGESS